MKKKTIGALAFAAVAALSLVSCDSDSSTTAKSYYGNVNVFLNYNGANGVTFQEAEAWTSSIDGLTYTQGTLLPTWKAFANNLNLSITDVADYSTSTDAKTYEAVQGRSFKTVDGAGIDLFYNTTSNINKMGAAGNAVDLYQEILAGNMPNFAQYLSDNPEVLDMISVDDSDGNHHIYYTPYFDGYQSVERMFIMDTEMVTRLLDSATGAGDSDNALDGTNGSTRLGTAQYQPFIDDNYNYPDAETTISVVNAAGDGTTTITVNQTTNIIKQQNEVLTEGSTTKGSELLDQFKTYLKAAYGDSYTKLSDIFVGQQACYNADDLIALMRVVRANPKTASGIDTITEIETLFPRGQAANRIENIYDFAQIWGLQGLDGESGNFFFDATGKLNNLNSMNEAYDALTYLHQLYAEGLIESSFYEVPSSADKTAGVTNYWSNTTTSTSTVGGFMLYDYCASTTVGNDKDSLGLGTSVSDREGVYANVSRKGIRPVINPVTYWQTTGEADPNKSIDDHTNETLMRYAESNRALKNTSWCIPTTAENKTGALKLMDYMFTAEGLRIQDFGPSEYQGSTSATLVTGELVPTLGDDLVKEYLDSGLDFWSFMRQYIGSTNGIGHVREDSLNLQATNSYAQTGQTYLDNAIKTGVVLLATCKTSEYYSTFGTCVPTSWDVSIDSSKATEYQNLTNFWNASGKGNSNWRKVVVEGTGTDNSTVVDDPVTLAQVKSQIEAYNKYYAAVYAQKINATPSWLSNLIG